MRTADSCHSRTRDTSKSITLPGCFWQPACRILCGGGNRAQRAVAAVEQHWSSLAVLAGGAAKTEALGVPDRLIGCRDLRSAFKGRPSRPAWRGAPAAVWLGLELGNWAAPAPRCTGQGNRRARRTDSRRELSRAAAHEPRCYRSPSVSLGARPTERLGATRSDSERLEATRSDSERLGVHRGPSVTVGHAGHRPPRGGAGQPVGDPLQETTRGSLFSASVMALYWRARPRAGSAQAPRVHPRVAFILEWQVARVAALGRRGRAEAQRAAGGTGPTSGVPRKRRTSRRHGGGGGEWRAAGPARPTG